jgi:uncharacterized protein (TIGR03435 family)
MTAMLRCGSNWRESGNYLKNNARPIHIGGLRLGYILETWSRKMARAAAAMVVLQMAWAFGQTGQPAFETASVKPGTAESGSSSGIFTRKGSIDARNVTLKRCIRGAYDTQESQIVGGPKWAGEDRYEIYARSAGPAEDHELMAMLQSLLAERFKLAFHRETRDLPGYALVVGRGGLRAKRSEPGADSRTNLSRTDLDAGSCRMHQLAQKLSEVIHLPVADLTGVEGEFDFHLKWTPEDMLAKAPSVGDKPAGLDVGAGLSVYAAVQEQLGLRLEPRKIPTEVLVIDHAEKPSEN